MKPLSSPFAFLGLAAAAIIVVGSCTMVHISPNQSAELYIGDPAAKPPKYVELKSNSPSGLATLRAKLATLKNDGGICELTYLATDTGIPDAHFCETIPVRIKTDRVIKSAAATNVGAVNAVANDPHLMYRIASPVGGDVYAVADLLKP